MQKIYEKQDGKLIATLPRTVNYYDSGLVQVSQVFVGRTDLANKFRSSLEVGDVFPTDTDIRSVNSIRIFPDVSENVRQDGMTDFIVNGYGRSNTRGITRYEYGVISFSRTIQNPPNSIPESYTITGVYRFLTKIVKRVLRESEKYNFKSDIDNENYTPELIAGLATLQGLWVPAVVDYTSQNYGDYQEITVAIRAVQAAV